MALLFLCTLIRAINLSTYQVVLHPTNAEYGVVEKPNNNVQIQKKSVPNQLKQVRSVAGALVQGDPQQADGTRAQLQHKATRGSARDEKTSQLLCLHSQNVHNVWISHCPSIAIGTIT